MSWHLQRQANGIATLKAMDFLWGERRQTRQQDGTYLEQDLMLTALQLLQCLLDQWQEYYHGFSWMKAARLSPTLRRVT